MSLTWRERIAAARTRGTFSRADLADAHDCHSCLLGEIASRLGLSYLDVRFTLYDPETGDLAPVGGWFPETVQNNKFDQAEALLDAAEDHMLVLKREQGG